LVLLLARHDAGVVVAAAECTLTRRGDSGPVF
jgi:hypothetical protein